MNLYDTDEPTDALVRMLERQRELVGELARLAQRQGGLIESGASEALLELLGRRQQVMDDFIASQDGMTRLAETLHAGQGAGVQEPLRGRIDALIDEISQRLSEIMRHDERDRASLQAGRDRAAESLADVQAAGRAREAYVRARAVKNRFADRRG